MFTKKDRRLANQAVMIKNRNKLIEGQVKRIAELEARLRSIKAIAESNAYGKPEVYLRKIKELTDMGSI